MALTRRRLLASAGAGGLAAAAGGGGFALGRETAPEAGPDAASQIVAFHGEHQAGIATPAQDRLHFAAFDIEEGLRARDLRDLLREWSRGAERMTAGQPVGEDDGGQLAPPTDTGEAMGLTPARLTVTFGLGPWVFDERFGLAATRPAPLHELPPLPGDELDPARSGGDLCVQACADDPQVAFHAVRNLARIGRGAVTVRWSQLGFGRTSSTSRAQATPRNLMGFKDGTRNLKAEDADALARHVWVAGDRSAEPAWLRGGTYLVAGRAPRRLRGGDPAGAQPLTAMVRSGPTRSERRPCRSSSSSSPTTSRRQPWRVRTSASGWPRRTPVTIRCRSA